jgi:hypothetical protein
MLKVRRRQNRVKATPLAEAPASPQAWSSGATLRASGQPDRSRRETKGGPAPR